MSKGKIIQVMGPVVDVAFEDDGLPHIKDALVVDNQGKKCVMEVAQHVGGNVVRCIMLASSDGLCKDMEVEPTGAGIQVPVGEKTLGVSSTYWARPLTEERAWKARISGSSTGTRRLLRTRALLWRCWRLVLR